MKIAQHKHTIQSKHNQTRQAIEKCWFNLLDFLRYCNKRDMAKDYGLQEIDFESLVEKVK
jgi:hypothetical protein